MDYFSDRTTMRYCSIRTRSTERDCYRVRIVRRDGSEVLSIDQETYVLRRLVLPTDGLRQAMMRQRADRQAVAGGRLRRRIRLMARSIPGRSSSRCRQGGELVDLLIPRQTPSSWAKKSPDFKFADLDGKPVTPQTLARPPGGPGLLDLR